jgi:hypothetical protein
VPAPSAVENPNAVRDAAQSALARPEFGDLEPHWYDQVVAFFNDPIGSILRWLELGIAKVLGLDSDGTYTVVVSCVIAAATFLVVLFVAIRLTRSVRSDEGAPVSFAPAFGSKSAADLEREATELEQNEEWRLALRSRYSALLTRLSDQGLLSPRPGRTTGEYRDELRINAPYAGAEFDEATALFEWVWYGDRSAQARDCERITALSKRVLQVAAA